MSDSYQKQKAFIVTGTVVIYKMSEFFVTEKIGGFTCLCYNTKEVTER